MFTKEQGDNHIKDRLYVYWDVTTKCNFRCSYCYARHKYPAEEWNKTAPWRNQLLVINAIKLSRLPVYLGFHGGEPTQHPEYTNLVLRTLDALHRDLDTLYIATNATHKILNTPDSPKIRILASFHPEFSQPDRFIQTIKELHPRFKTKVNILLHTDEQYWPHLHKVYEECINLGVTVHPHFIYDQVNELEVLWNYSPKFYKEFSYMNNAPCWYEFTLDDGCTQKITDIELFERNLNHFKGWTCYNNNYEILNNSSIHRLCTNDYIDLTKHPFYLRNITEVKPMICPFETCSSDGVLKCLKEHPQSI